MDKTTAFQNFLGTNSVEIEAEGNLLFSTSDGEEYYVCTEKEANLLAEQEILQYLWAFNSDFIVEHTKVYDDLTIGEAEILAKNISEMTCKMCDNANTIVELLIEDINEFIEDAIEADGRGHFISMYDGREHEQDGYYIYRIS